MMHIWGSRHKDWYCLPSIGSSGGILIIWDEMIFNKKEPFWDHTLYPLDFLLTSTASLFSWNNMNALYWLSREKKYLQLNQVSWSKFNPTFDYSIQWYEFFIHLQEFSELLHMSCASFTCLLEIPHFTKYFRNASARS